MGQRIGCLQLVLKMEVERIGNEGYKIKGILKNTILASSMNNPQLPIVTLDESTNSLNETDDEIMEYEGYMNKVKQGQMGEIQIIKETFHPLTKVDDDSDFEESRENHQLLVPNSEFKPGRRGGILQQTSYKAEAKFVILDIGGERFRANRESFLPYPATRLGKMINSSDIKDILECCDEFLPGDPPEFFFDYNPDSFPGILEMYRTGKFHIPDGGRQCAFVMRRDFTYWGLDELNLEACCALKYYPQIGVCQAQKEGDDEENLKDEEMYEADNFDNTGLCGRFRSLTWDTLEKPWTSPLAQNYALFSLFVVLVSTVTFVASTAEELQVDENGVAKHPTITAAIEYVDFGIVIFFSWEYATRLICSPNKLKFFIEKMNLVDCLALIPFYVALLLEGLEDYEIIGKATKIVRLMKVIRVLRVYKLFRHFAGLQSLIYTLQQAYKELGLLLHIIGVAILTFSSLVYICESELGDQKEVEFNNKTFYVPADDTWTFLESFWWGLMTLTTVGYDISPKTFLGKFVGGFCALAGVFTITLPIPIVVNSFAGFYKNRLWRNEVSLKKRMRVEAEKKERRKSRLSSLINGTDGTLAEKNVRSKKEMTVGDILRLTE